MYSIIVRKVIEIEIKAKTTFFTEAPIMMQVDSMQEFKVWAINHMDAKGYIARNGNRVYYVRMEGDEVIANILHKAITIRPFVAKVTFKPLHVVCNACSWKTGKFVKVTHAKPETVKKHSMALHAKRDKATAQQIIKLDD